MTARFTQALLCLTLACLTGTALHAQSAYAPLNADYYHTIERYEIKQGHLSEFFFSNLKPYTRQQVAQFADRADTTLQQLSRQDVFNLNYLQQDNWEWSQRANAQSKKPIFNTFYKQPATWLHARKDGFDLHVNPVLYLGTGNDDNALDRPFFNTRGIQVRGSIDDKIGFYTFLGENQARFAGYANNWVDSIGAVPGEWFWKDYNQTAFDYFTVRGYITFKATEHVQLQFGHDRNVIGNGFRSLILSDHAPAYLFLKVNTQIWKFTYTNLFTQLTADVIRTPSGVLNGDSNFPKKYMAFHHLGINIGKNINVGVFEAVMFGNTDSTASPGFDLNYLNPIIFYRAVEQKQGSAGNSLLGIDAKWNFLQRFSLYGQFVLDEFLLDNVREGNGWWGNKFAAQIGLKYIDAFGIPNLDVQVEHNVARPFIYSHRTEFAHYAHYRQALAHPQGANFRESLAIIRYQPIPRLALRAKLIYLQHGSDPSDSLNWGGDILKSYDLRVQDFNNEILQGVATDMTSADLTATFMVRHNLFVDLRHLYRREDSQIDARDNTTNYTSIALRWNIPEKVFDF